MIFTGMAVPPLPGVYRANEPNETRNDPRMQGLGAHALIERHAAAHRHRLTGHVGIVEQHHDGLGDLI
jgi:hypothetical protein